MKLLIALAFCSFFLVHFSTAELVSGILYTLPHESEPATGNLRVRLADESITINFDQNEQLIEGFGFCQTFGRAYWMNGSEGLPYAKQREVLDLLLSPSTGAGFSILRLGVFGIQPDSPGGPDSVMGPTIARSGLNVSLMCCDSLGWNQQAVYSRAVEADPEASAWVNIHAGHSYASRSSSPLPTNKPVWMSEYALDASASFNPYWDEGGDNSGISLANHIHDTLVSARVNAYITWFGASTGAAAAPISLEGSEYFVAKRLWATAAYSRFIRPNAYRVSATSSIELVKVSAFRNAGADGGSQARVVNLINNDDRVVELDLTLNGAVAGELVRVYRTDETYSLQYVGEAELIGPQTSIDLPRRSLITLIIEGRSR